MSYLREKLRSGAGALRSRRCGTSATGWRSEMGRRLGGLRLRLARRHLRSQSRRRGRQLLRVARDERRRAARPDRPGPARPARGVRVHPASGRAALPLRWGGRRGASWIRRGTTRSSRIFALESPGRPLVTNQPDSWSARPRTSIRATARLQTRPRRSSERAACSTLPRESPPCPARRPGSSSPDRADPPRRADARDVPGGRPARARGRVGDGASTVRLSSSASSLCSSRSASPSRSRGA